MKSNISVIKNRVAALPDWIFEKAADRNSLERDLLKFPIDFARAFRKLAPLEERATAGMRRQFLAIVSPYGLAKGYRNELAPDDEWRMEFKPWVAAVTLRVDNPNRCMVTVRLDHAALCLKKNPEKQLKREFEYRLWLLKNGFEYAPSLLRPGSIRMEKTFTFAEFRDFGEEFAERTVRRTKEYYLKYKEKNPDRRKARR